MKEKKPVNTQDLITSSLIDTDNQTKNTSPFCLLECLEDKKYEKVQIIIDLFNSDYAFYDCFSEVFD